jgi:hypothetical protein
MLAEPHESRLEVAWIIGLPLRGTLTRGYHLVVIFDHPLRIIREFGETSFEPLKSTNLFGAIR